MKLRNLEKTLVETATMLPLAQDGKLHLEAWLISSGYPDGYMDAAREIVIVFTLEAVYNKDLYIAPNWSWCVRFCQEIARLSILDLWSLLNNDSCS